MDVYNSGFLRLHITMSIFIIKFLITYKGWLMFSNYNNKVQMFYSNSNEDINNGIRSENISSTSKRTQLIITDWDCAKVK